MVTVKRLSDKNVVILDLEFIKLATFDYFEQSYIIANVVPTYLELVLHVDKQFFNTDILISHTFSY